MPAFHQSAATAAAVFVMKPSHIFVLSSLLAALGALLALQKMAWVFCLGAALVFFLSALIMGSGRKGAAAVTISFLVLFFLAQGRLCRLSPTSRDLSRLQTNVVSFSGRVESSKIKDTDKGRFVAAVIRPNRLLLPWSKELDGKVLAHIGPFTQQSQVVPTWGGQYVFTGHLTKPRARVFSFEFDQQRWLALQEIYCQVSVSAKDVQTLGQAEDRPGHREESGDDAGDHFHAPDNRSGVGQGQQSLFSQLEACAAIVVQDSVLLREGIVATHTRALGDERGKLLTSMVLGDRAVSLSDSTKAAFARVGLSHLLAASGLNLTIIVGAAVFLFGLTGRNKGARCSSLVQTLGVLVCVLFFVSLAGASPSVTRATIMCLLLLWSGLVFRTLAKGSTVAAALWLALLCDPLSILDVGLELSYGATFGIIYFYPLFIAALPERLTKRPWHWLCSLCAVVLAAQLAVLPVQIYYFQKLSTLVLPANVLAEPLVAPITVLGFLSSLLSAMAIVCGWGAAGLLSPIFHMSLLSQVLTQVSFVIDFLCGYLIDLLIGLTHFLGSLPISYLYLARPPVAAVVSYYLALAMAFTIGLSRPLPCTMLAFSAGLLFTGHSFLMSSWLEVLVTNEKVVIVSPMEPPKLLILPETSEAGYCDAGIKRFSPACRRDFVQSYLRSLSGRGDSTTCTSKMHSLSQSSGLAGFHSPLQPAGLPSVGCCLLRFDNQDIVDLCLEAGRPELVSVLPDGAIEVEEAQGVKLYKFKTWGLVCLVATRLGQGWPPTCK